jgi:D-alanyl-D-alanine carboxypeptidase/D-alanyl-D-alanine-endopeptidase (penicillin-binding protein 4)
VPLVMLALFIAVGSYFAVGASRQYLADRSFHPIVVPAAVVPPAGTGAALADLLASPPAVPGPAAAPVPTAAGVATLLAPRLADPALGPSVAAQVYDAATGAVLVDRRSAALVAPASTSKLLTAAAVLTVHKPTDRFTTTVVAGPDPQTVVLVGGGDPTLSGAAVGAAVEYPGAARISDLAATVKAARTGRPVTRVLVDGSLFSGAATAPGWAADDAPSSYASPITALLVDAGRDAPGATLRSAAPELAAGRALAAALGGARVGRGSAPAGATVLAAVGSAPVARLVEQMIDDSDNVLAEVLARQVAISLQRPATFAGAAAAITATLAGQGIAVGAGMKDGSGLSVLDRVPARVLGQVLLAAVSSRHPELRPVVAGLSVAGWDGTLVEQGRFSGAAARVDGAVRAKTGSLTGVSSLTGLVGDADGRQLVFSFVADRVPSADPGPSRTALDQLAVALAGCGCR